MSVAISVLIWDTPEYAEGLLRNLFFEQPIGETPHKVYVLDQGSGWKTRRVLRRYRDRVQIVRVKENVGFPAGHNLVFETAMSAGPVEAFCVLNSDVRFAESNWLDRLVETLHSDQKNAVAGPVGIQVNPGPERRGHGTIATSEDMAAGKYDMLSGCISLIRSTVAMELGLYDEVFTPGYFEDGDMGYRYHEAGYRSVYCPLKFEHGYLGPRTSTAKQHKDVLRKKFGNFREKNRQCFVSRWGHLFGPEG
jgi:O-antigen biosynthesis protein